MIFDGLNTATADVGTVKFDVNAFRCHSAEAKMVNPATSPLSINHALYIRIESNIAGIVVKKNPTLSLKKIGGIKGYNTVTAGVGHFDTFMNIEGESTAPVGTCSQENTL